MQPEIDAKTIAVVKYRNLRVRSWTLLRGRCLIQDRIRSCRSTKDVTILVRCRSTYVEFCGTSANFRDRTLNPVYFGAVKSLALKSIAIGINVSSAPLERFSELVYLKRLLEKLRVNCVLDVGANKGQFAHEIRGIGYSGRIVSFEPVEREFAALSHSFAGDLQWRGFRIALGSRNESACINVPELTVLSSLLEFEQNGIESKREIVDVRRLDEMLPDVLADIVEPRVFLKMDTQGFDLEVFRGSENCLDLLCGMQSEVSVRPLYKHMPHYIEALSTYEAAGFELDSLTAVNGIAGGIVELNAFLTRSAKSC